MVQKKSKSSKPHCDNDLKCLEQCKEADNVNNSQEFQITSKQDFFKKTQQNFKKSGKDIYLVDKSVFKKMSQQ